jgi:6-pyruvoyltetrahydropterin/6-carboxytetrahydropterin synthase
MAIDVTATRYHDFCAGHRVVGHENKCRHLHGHNYRAHFQCRGELDNLGRVIDFSVIKQRLCEWVEATWDHKFLIWDQDPFLPALKSLDPASLCPVPFNPTAERLAEHLLTIVGPRELAGTGVELVRVTLEETRKCLATAGF